MAAVSIMASCCQASLLCLCILCFCLLQVFIHGQVFVPGRQAHDVLLRSRRANRFLLEEFLQGNLERECHEERCNFEEAREYFEDTEKTISFWTIYYDGDQCQPKPCLHGGNCTDKVGGFLCSCPAPYFGQACELGVSEQWPPTAPQVTEPEMVECPTEGPTACQQMCTASAHSFACSCLTGFKLHTDKRSCVPEVAFPCGRLPESTSMCPHGNCPWQVSVVDSQGVELCSGVLLGRRSVLSSAHCLLQYAGPNLNTSRFFLIAGNNMKSLPVRALHIHHRFRMDHHDNDLALLELSRPLRFGPTLFHLCLAAKDFSENILMNSEKTGIARMPGSELGEELIYIGLDNCRDELNVSYPLSNKMFCMRRRDQSHQAWSPPPEDRNQHGRHGAPDEAKNKSSSSLIFENLTSLRSDETQRPKVSNERLVSPLPGMPVATLEQGTAFLTGLLISSSVDGHENGFVFTKLSRHLTWIRPRVETAEERMTPQVISDPDMK